METKENRRGPRVEAPLTVYDLVSREAMSTRNVSVGGLYLLSATRRAVGSVLQLGLSYGTCESRALCRVTHLQADGFGVAFVDPDDALLVFVQQIIDDLLSRTSQSNRRQAWRENTDVHVLWRHGTTERRGRLCNVSQGGAFIETDSCPEPGIELLVYLPGYTYAVDSSQPSEARGCVSLVIHKDKRGIGVRFQNPSAEFRMAVDGVMRRAHK